MTTGGGGEWGKGNVGDIHLELDLWGKKKV